MGQTIKPLAKAELQNPAVFNNRFVVESCEDFHFHYRNLRLRISPADWTPFAKGFADAYQRWERLDRPHGKHTELCRKKVATIPKNDGIQVNLNKNLYKLNNGKIFAEGSNFIEDDDYIHVKYRDMRLEMSIDEFKKFSDCVSEARKNLDA